MATIRNLREWLVQCHHEYVVADEPVKGTYGLIWFLSNPRPHAYPRALAVKTLDPEALIKVKSAKDIDYLRREFRMWLWLPRHFNVVPALGFDTAHLSSEEEHETISLPVMRMPKMTGSLQEWIDDSAFGIEDRLIALAQSVNGLMHLYKNGFEGHGDLKPSNILYADLKERFSLELSGMWPSRKHPWHVCVADLGWADAWVDLGFTNKALRQYLAPERLDGAVVPVKSDMFSMGIVAAELLQRRHPASNLKKALGSEGKWASCIKNEQWTLEGVRSERLRLLIQRCLAFDHEGRPTTEEFLGEIFEELRESYGQDISRTLQVWTEQSSDWTEHAEWAARHTIGLGVQEVRRSRKTLERRLRGIAVVDLQSCELWLSLATALHALLKSEEPDSLAEIAQLRSSAETHMKAVLGKINRSAMEAVAPSPNWTAFQPFERFSQSIEQVAEITGVTYESQIVEAGWLGPLALAALAYITATRAHQAGRVAEEEHFLAEAIRHAPEEAVPYYYRALWRRHRWFVLSARTTQIPTANDLKAWFTDLEVANRLAPSWNEPKKLLQDLQWPHYSSRKDP